MFGYTIFLVAATVSAGASASSCIPPIYAVPVPSTIQSAISSPLHYAPSLYTMEETISMLELDEPSVVPAVTELEYYLHLYSSVLRELERIYLYPSLYTDLSAVDDITSAYPTLAHAVSKKVSVCESHPRSGVYLQTLRSVALTNPSILTDLSIAIDLSYPAIYTASNIITEATLISSSIFGSVLAVSTAVSTLPTVSYALSYLSYAVYTLPSSVATEILTIISSPSTAASSTVSSLEQCYSTVYSYVEEVTSFTYSHPSVVSDVTAYLSIASVVSSLGSAVATIVYYEAPTFLYEASVLASADYEIPTLSDDLPVLEYYLALSPTLYHAEVTIEQSFYNSPYTASSIYIALEYPSLVTEPSAISSYEETHESLVTALDYVISFESYYSSIASTLSYIESQVTSAFISYRTLLTAYSFVQTITSVSEVQATLAISSAKSIESDVTYVLSDLTYVLSRLPSLSCAESEIEYYAEVYPSTAAYLWSIYDGYVSVPDSSISYVAMLIASNPSLDSALSMVVSGDVYYSSLFTLESSFIYAAATDSSLLTEYETMSQEASSEYSDLSSVWSSY